MRAVELHRRDSARIFQPLMSKHQIILMKKPPSQSPSPSPQREGHVAVAVHEVAVEVVAGAAVEVELRILPEALLPEISFSLL